jgi:hypothetical protein
MPNKVELMLDSGAFSAWNKREPELDLKAYAAFCKQHADLLFSCVNMDKIPGIFGQRRSLADIRNSAAKSYDNLQELKSLGVRPIPVFHQNEEFKWLERMLADGETYIGLSLGKEGGGGRFKWLDTIFNMICDSKGKPLVRTHGFGITKASLLLPYPWYSTDSTTWSVTPAFGKILIPSPGSDGEPDYSIPPVGIAVSGVPNVANNATQFEGDAFFKGKGTREDYIRRIVEEEFHATIPGLRYDPVMRQRCVLMYYVRLMQHAKVKPYRRGLRSFFSNSYENVTITGKAKIEPLRVMFATLMNNYAWGVMMNECSATTRLLSYYEIRDADPERLRQFVINGVVTRKSEPRRQRLSIGTEAYKNRNKRNLLKHLSRYEGGEIDGNDDGP